MVPRWRAILSLVSTILTVLNPVHSYTQGKPIMILGTHELKGEVVMLKEPFCVMNKRKRDEEEVDYTVVGVVTKKLLFDRYPKTIMR